MAYIDQAYVDARIGAPLRQALFTDDGAYSEPHFLDALSASTARVRGALGGAGYAVPDDDDITEMLSGTEAQASDAQNIRMATFDVFIRTFAQPRKEWRIPEEIKSELRAFELIEDGTIAFETLPLDEGDAVGGVEFSDNDPGDVYAPVFSRTMGR